MVTATVAAGQEALLDGLRLTGGDGIAVETLPVRDRAARAVAWRARTRTTGTHTLTLHAPDNTTTWTKRVAAGPGLPALARPGSSGGRSPHSPVRPSRPCPAAAR